jgi:hypothetical protein
MITKAQAIESREFHAGSCTRHVGPRGGVTEKTEVWRRKGQTQLWKTRPDDFRVPVKYGLYGYGSIYNNNDVHVPEDCPLNDPEYRTN